MLNSFIHFARAALLLTAPIICALLVLVIFHAGGVNPFWGARAVSGLVILAGLVLAAWYRSRDESLTPGTHSRLPFWLWCWPVRLIFVLLWATVFASASSAGAFLVFGSILLLAILRLGVWPGVLVAGTIGVGFALGELDWAFRLPQVEWSDFWGPLDPVNRHYEHLRWMSELAGLSWWGNSSTSRCYPLLLEGKLGPYGRAWVLHAMWRVGIIPALAFLMVWIAVLTAVAVRLSSSEHLRVGVSWLKPLAAAIVWLHVAASIVYLMWTVGWLRQPFSPGLAPWVGNAAWWVLAALPAVLLVWNGLPARSANIAPSASRLVRIALTTGLILAMLIWGRAGWIKYSAPGEPPTTQEAQPVRVVETPAPDVPTDPPWPDLPEITETKALELGDAILLLMPDRGTSSNVFWDHRADSIIYWLDSPTHTETEGCAAGRRICLRRIGAMRMHVMGQPTNKLARRNDELWWTVRFEGAEDPKWGVSRIDLWPGNPPDVPAECRGAYFKGCAFQLRPSLRRAGIEARRVCGSISNIRSDEVFRLSHPKKRTVDIRVSTNSSSVGSHSSLTLFVGNDINSSCEE